MEVVNLVKEKRIEKGFSQDDVALFLDLSRGFVGQIESPNSPSKYNLNHLNKLALEFQCSPKDFIPKQPVSEKRKKK